MRNVVARKNRNVTELSDQLRRILGARIIYSTSCVASLQHNQYRTGQEWKTTTHHQQDFVILFLINQLVNGTASFNLS